ncbi:MAG: hypothetical protein HZB53_15660 [Chloroflexi bacterium]|nr:hypothetical protein [Chloroflexota bacterium]
MIAPDHALAFPVAPVLSAYWVQPGLLAGAYPAARHNTPLSVERIERLLAAGVRTFLDLTEALERDPYLYLIEAAAAAHGLAVRHERLPMRDYQAPSLDEMRCILDQLDSALAGGDTVYLHCWGGIGRTGTVVGCRLARHGMPGAAALREVMRLRRNALCGEMSSPDTPEQRQFVLEWPTGM